MFSFMWFSLVYIKTLLTQQLFYYWWMDWDYYLAILWLSPLADNYDIGSPSVSLFCCRILFCELDEYISESALATLLSRYCYWRWLFKKTYCLITALNVNETKMCYKHCKSLSWVMWVITPTLPEICWHACLPYHLCQGCFWQLTFLGK